MGMPQWGDTRAGATPARCLGYRSDSFRDSSVRDLTPSLL